MDYFRTYPVEAIGSLLLLTVFIGGALINLIYWNNAKEYVRSQGYTDNANFILFGGVLWQLLGITLLAIPSTALIGCIVLILFVFVSTLQFYQFWDKEGLNRYTNMLNVLSNLGVMGGLFLLLAQIQLHKFPLSFDFIAKCY
ncbi:MAG: hypothetical protein BGO67_02645 [Alphaproteobacteria bacterium 41-28]|nr:MAG: hypothetical protein BGO67_02645 [Alphaproteobacteria bacterium 41-28]